MTDKFIIFLRNLGFSKTDLTGSEKQFNYKVAIGNDAFEEVKYVYTPTNDDVFEHHRLFWNKNDTNSFIAIGENKTHLIDAKTKPNKQNPLNNRNKIASFNYGVNTAGFDKEEIKTISKESVDTTYFFDFVIRNRKKSHEVDKDLLLNLISLKNDLMKINGSEDVVHLIILRSLFIKYLEDKEIYPKNYLSNVLFSKNTRKFLKAFEEIKKINGDIFERQISENEINILFLEKLSLFFSSDYRSGQGMLFPYLFDQIPIQLISNVYECFLHDDEKRNRGIYYTPQFLVKFVLSHSLEKVIGKNPGATILDPAVGSGAFLVESFKTILSAHSTAPSYSKKKEILQRQLFGIDTDEKALQIAAFSLYLTLIETEEPSFIREQIINSHPILPSLIGKNLIKANALADSVFEGKTFNFILSNPPWGSAEPNNQPENIKERLAIEENSTYKGFVSDYERSQAFLLRVKDWSDEDTLFSLIVKNSIFLNDLSRDFRERFLRTYHIKYFYELSNYNKILFKKKEIGEVNGHSIKIGATEPCAVLLFKNTSPDYVEHNDIKYVSPKLSDFAESFQIIHYTQNDSHTLKQEKFLQDDSLWRVLAKGGLEDYQLIKKYSHIGELDIECRAGFKATPSMKPIGSPDYRELIEPKNFVQYKMLSAPIKFNYNQEMERRRDEKIFTGNRLLFPNRPLLRDDFRLRCIEIDSNAVHKDNISCIRLKKNDVYIDNLISYLGIFNSKFAGYFLYYTSSQWDTGEEKRDKIKNSDIENFPIPLFKKGELSRLESTVKRILKADQSDEIEGLKEKIDQIVFDLYDLKEYDREIINEFYEVKTERSKGKNRLVRLSDFENYTAKFSEVFNLMIEPGSKLIATKYNITAVGSIVCFTIINESDSLSFSEDKTLGILHFVKDKQLQKPEIPNILNEEKVKIYDDKFMYIIKSNFFKDWTVRQAIKDAREEINLIVSSLPETK